VPFRAFVGIPLKAEPALVALLDALDATGADLKVVAPDHLHLTLSFLGDVPDDAAGPLARALDDATRGERAFPLALAGVGAFPSARRARVVWAGARDPARVSALAAKVRASLAAAGHQGDDKDFRAHVTLARVRSDRGADKVERFLQAHGRDELPTVPVEEVVLFRSTLGPHGPAYDRVHVARLGAID